MRTFSFLPLKNTVVFPHTTTNLSVGRERSVNALLQAKSSNMDMIVVGTQRRQNDDSPMAADLFEVATLCKINESVGSKEKCFQLVVTGVSRFRVKEFFVKDDCLWVSGDEEADEDIRDDIKEQALFNNVRQLAIEILNLLPVGGGSISSLLGRIDDPTYLSYICASFLTISVEQKQELLEERNVSKRLETIISYLNKEREVLHLQNDIRDKMSKRLSKAQRDGMLREQMQAIKEELGEGGGVETHELREKIDSAGLSGEAQKVAHRELERLEGLSSMSPEYRVTRDYLQWLVDMPWKKSTNDHLDLKAARKILDEDHYGLERVKKRILQHLAVAKLKNNLKGSILCLVGPPGVGKTSLGQSIARALGRKFIRTSLGGVHDESEIRGHRRTYVGAVPGRIVDAVKRSGVNNPVFMLDEIDKLGISGFHGDPASAMLEVLDPEQNSCFVDHYLDVAFDLSNVFFITTANVLDSIPEALRDRMEIIEVSGYTMEEKLHIAKEYLVEKLLKEHGLSAEQVQLKDKALEMIISHYTREAGVRELQRQIAALCRVAAEEVTAGENLLYVVGVDEVKKALGPEKFFSEIAERVTKPGVVTGLAWTPHGGEILFVESNAMPGSGKLILTGKLGEVMKESAQIALSLVRAESARFAEDFNFEKMDIHIHVPSGAIPKDGPSAGVALLTSLASLLMKKRVEHTIAMTGEITLRGAVLPVGGIKEKVIAAHRAGVKTVILPKRNKKDLTDIPDAVLSNLKFIFVETTEELWKNVFGEDPSSGQLVSFG